MILPFVFKFPAIDQVGKIFLALKESHHLTRFMGRKQSDATQHKKGSRSWLPGKQSRCYLHGPHVFCAIATWFFKEMGPSLGDASTARKAWKLERFHLGKIGIHRFIPD